MRALTVQQPWAWAIIHGGKTVENRSRNVAGAYRGPVAIHASLTVDTAAFDDPTMWAALAPFRDHGPDAPTSDRLDAVGVFLGVVDLVGSHTPTALCGSPWEDPDAGAHLVLVNPRPLEQPIPYRGRLGLWTPDPFVVEQLQGVTT